MAKSRHGFSIIEMLLVIAIIMILISLLLPSLNQTRRAGRLAVCTSNMHQIYLAKGHRKVDVQMRSIPDALGADAWPEELAPFVDGDSRVYMCPEDDEGGGSVKLADDWWAGRGPRGSEDPATIGSWYDMSGGPFHKKISQTQWQELTSKYGDRVDGRWGPYWRNDYTGFVDDGSGSFYLMVEDAGFPGAPGGDQDFNDVVVRIERQDNGDFHGSARQATASTFWAMLGPDRENVFRDNGHNGAMHYADINNWFGPHVMEGVTLASYGLNKNVNEVDIAPDKVLWIDYEKVSVNPDAVNGDDWNNYIDDYGEHTFARHLNHRFNVMFADGSISQEDTSGFDPAYQENREEYWEPGLPPTP